jgi:hypothetical protein
MNWKFWQSENNTDLTSQMGTSYPTNYPPSTRNVIYKKSYDGEKTDGELGSIYDLTPDYLKLRLRAYELDLKTDIVKIITGKFFKWCIGTGLKLQSEPENNVLDFLKYEPLTDNENNQKERLFNLWAKSKLSDYVGRDNLHKKATDAFKTAFLGGDCLSIIRVENKGITVQVVDGEQVETPFDQEKKGAKNKIVNGIELNQRGEHIAFWVKTNNTNTSGLNEYERVEAKDKNGNLRSWMIYGTKHRIDHQRGIPAISSILEKISKLDRFVEASVSKAEKMADLVYAFEHEDFSTGENPLGGLGAKKVSGVSPQIDSFEESGRTALQLRQSTSGEVLNLPKGAKLKALSNDSETSFDQFYKAVFKSLCASIDVPPEVAIQMYEQSYSSSRAAINMWEHIIEIYREFIIVENFYKPIYRFWCYYNTLNGTFDNPGYERAIKEGNDMALEAYYACRFIGKKMPHIDPLKEAKAIRSLLADDAPLINREQATEMANGGDWQSNYKKFKEESTEIEPKQDGESIQTN